MGIQFYDSSYNLFNTDPLRTVHNGKSGGAQETLIYIRNDDISKWYSDLVLSYENSINDDYGLNSSTGWSVKFLKGTRQPTEGEWSQIESNESILIDDIGNNTVADITQYHPIWIRVYCPGNSKAQIREGQRLILFYTEHLVGE